MKHLGWILIGVGALLYFAENSTASFPGHATLSTFATNFESVSPLPLSAGTTFVLIGGGILAYHHFA